MRSSAVLLFLAGLLSLLSLASAQGNHLFPKCDEAPLLGTPICDPTLPYSQRAAWVVQQMNVSEKVSRLVNGSPPVERLGLPGYEWWSEALHGVAGSPGVDFAREGNFSCATSFPEPIGLGATFDRELIRLLAGVTGTEARAFNNVNRAGLDFWTPNINIFRDPRWGRGQETPGEDPYLSSEYVYYLIRGYQEGEDSKYYQIVADCKHYAGYDIEDWHGNERYGYNAVISMQDLVETYLPSFKSCLKDAHVGSAMCSYNAVNGVPACANGFLMNEIARERWGWEGWITSDCDAIGNIYDSHHYVSNFSALVQVSLRAGCDIDCGGTLAAHGVQAYNDGAINDLDLDIALYRQFASLVRLGYFDPPANQPYRQYGWERVNTPYAQALDRLATLESVVLLKNDGTLPLDESSVSSVAIVGPHGNNSYIQEGNYNGRPCFIHTPLTTLQAMSGLSVTYAKGADVNSSSTAGFQEALNNAKNADVILYIGGIDESIESEGHDRNTIDLPGQQLNLLKQLEAVNKPLIVLLYGGGGVDITYLRDSSNTRAIIWAGYPAQSGGDAIVDVLFGRYSPAGRLPVTWYPADYVEQVPMTDQSMRASDSNPGRTYKFYTGTPVFPFGHGLSYSTFSYQVVDAVRPTYRIADLAPNARADEPQLRDVALTLNVTNTGSVRSDVVVLAFVNSSASPEGVTPPLKELFDYARVRALRPGASEVITFGLSYRVLTHVDLDGHSWLLPGRYRVTLQNEEEVVQEFELLGEPALIEHMPQPSTTPSHNTAAHKHLRSHAAL